MKDMVVQILNRNAIFINKTIQKLKKCIYNLLLCVCVLLWHII